jgi:hypothetical protein
MLDVRPLVERPAAIAANKPKSLARVPPLDPLRNSRATSSGGGAMATTFRVDLLLVLLVFVFVGAILIGAF